MGGNSTIKRLPPKVRELIGELRRNGRTIDEILEKLRELDTAVSRAALGRWTKQLDAISEDIERNRTVAEALVDRFGDKPDNRAARMNIELMHALITRLMFSDEGKMVSIDPQEAYFLGTALQRLAQAQKTDTDRMTKMRDEARKEAAAAAVAVATDVAKQAGLSQEVIDTIQRDVLRMAE